MDIFEMKKILDRKEKEKSNLEGQLKAKMQSVETKFGCKTLAASKKKQEQIRKELDEKSAQLDVLEEEIAEKYPWNS